MIVLDWPVSLSDHVDNLSGILNCIDCTKCMERGKINSECCFVRLKNTKLIYRCKECKKKKKKKWKRPMEGLIRKFPSKFN